MFENQSYRQFLNRNIVFSMWCRSSLLQMCMQGMFIFQLFFLFSFLLLSGFFLGFFFSDLGGDAKKPPKKNFFLQVQAGFPLIFMENFSKTVKICPKRGQKFSRSAQKSLFISRKYVITRDDNVHQEPNQPFFSCSTEPSLSTRRNGGHDIRTFWRSHGTQHFKKL